MYTQRNQQEPVRRIYLLKESVWWVILCIFLPLIASLTFDPMTPDPQFWIVLVFWREKTRCLYRMYDLLILCIPSYSGVLWFILFAVCILLSFLLKNGLMVSQLYYQDCQKYLVRLNFSYIKFWFRMLCSTKRIRNSPSRLKAELMASWKLIMTLVAWMQH